MIKYIVLLLIILGSLASLIVTMELGRMVFIAYIADRWYGYLCEISWIVAALAFQCITIGYIVRSWDIWRKK